MKTWPNWVDLIVVILLLKGCYSGFGRGVLAEVLNLIGAVSVTALAINYWPLVASWARPWLWVAPPLADFLVCGALFLTLLLVVHLVVRRVTDLLKWERLHWAIQGLGLVLGGLRALWWSGVLLVVLVSSGFAYLQESVEDRSVVGPQLASGAFDSVERIADRFPGAEHRRRRGLIPAMRGAAATSAPTPEPKPQPW